MEDTTEAKDFALVLSPLREEKSPSIRKGKRLSEDRGV